ncbi:MAG: hypothetical protein EBR53_03185, partial [Actinobacteria bacterium]|nr:hypothetical protein [Actinomycetota bacterium]
MHKSGYDVIVVDKATFPRDKCCGDGLTTGALRVLEELDFDPRTVPSWTVCEDVRLRSPGGREMHMPLPHGAGQFAAITPRIELDNALVQQAKNAGVSVLEGHAFNAIDNSSRDFASFGILRGGKYSVQDMKDLWPNLLQREHIREALGANAVMEDRHTAWPIPARVTTATLSSGRVLFVGDAACVTDSLTGEGIGQALLSGQLAGQAIVATGNREPSIARRKYE